MSFVMITSLITGALCGVWSEFAPFANLAVWLGFAGCTTYFMTGKSGIQGVMGAMRQNLLGIACATVCIWLSVHFPFKGDQILYSGFITWVMCYMGKFDAFSLVPGSFIGCFSTFAASGDLKVVIPAIIAGEFLGLICDKTGILAYTKFGKKED